MGKMFPVKKKKKSYDDASVRLHVSLSRSAQLFKLKTCIYPSIQLTKPILLLLGKNNVYFLWSILWKTFTG